MVFFRHVHPSHLSGHWISLPVHAGHRLFQHQKQRGGRCSGASTGRLSGHFRESRGRISRADHAFAFRRDDGRHESKRIGSCARAFFAARRRAIGEPPDPAGRVAVQHCRKVQLQRFADPVRQWHFRHEDHRRQIDPGPDLGPPGESCQFGFRDGPGTFGLSLSGAVLPGAFRFPLSGNDRTCSGDCSGHGSERAGSHRRSAGALDRVRGFPRLSLDDFDSAHAGSSHGGRCLSDAEF